MIFVEGDPVNGYYPPKWDEEDDIDQFEDNCEERCHICGRKVGEGDFYETPTGLICVDCLDH